MVRGRGKEKNERGGERRRWKRRKEDKTGQEKKGQESGEHVFRLLNIITSCVHLNSCI